MFEDKREIFTIEEAAALIRISKGTMYKIVASGDIRSRRVGRKIIITKKSLIDYLEQTTVYPQQQVNSSVGKVAEQ